MPAPVPYLTMLRRETVQRLKLSFPVVYDSRLPQLKREHLPAIRVYTNTVNEVGRSLSIPDFQSTAHLLVQVVCEDITDAAIAERVDVYCELIKTRLLTDPLWLQLFEQVDSVDLEIDRHVEGEWRLTAATLDFGLRYSTTYEPDVKDWLTTMDVRVDVIDPAADPNTAPPYYPPNVEGGYPGGYPGPDGRIEVGWRTLMPGPFPTHHNGQSKGK